VVLRDKPSRPLFYWLRVVRGSSNHTRRVSGSKAARASLMPITTAQAWQQWLIDTVS
jgi:hypothetical protein